MRNLLFLSALCLGLSSIARADTVFTLMNNTYEGGGVAHGTLTIDTVNGTFTSVNIVFSVAGTNYLFTGAPDTQSSLGSQYYEGTFDNGGDPNGDLLVIDVALPSLVGFAGGALCTSPHPCSDGMGFTETGYFTNADQSVTLSALSGSLATTPEPSSVVLLGTGLLAAAGSVRRRVLGRDL